VTVRGRYLSASGDSYAVIVYPKGDIGERDFFERFVADVLSVDPKTTGHPVTHLDFTHQIHRGFAQATAFAAIAVLLLVLLDLRRLRELAIAVAPVIIGGGWTALLIWALGIDFNYASIMALPILIGCGVDFGINLAHRARQEGSAKRAVRTTGKAIGISASTALLGFGTLMISDHWGAKSLGIILVIGIAACLVAALVVMPVLVERLYAKKAESPRPEGGEGE
jgi:predicted RND superfamily exporter protein